MKRTFAVLGGDARQSYLARLLAADGHPTVTYALENSACNVTLSQAVQADCVVLPLPLSREEGLLHCRERVKLEELWQLLRPGQFICGGQIGAKELADAYARDLRLEDYFLREELTVVNAVPTALAVGHRKTGMSPHAGFYGLCRKRS